MNQIALSSNDLSISYSELDDHLEPKIKKLRQHGLTNHRVMIIGQADYKTVDDYLWVLAVIENGGCAATGTTKFSQTELKGRLDAGNITAVVQDGEITICKDTKQKTKLSDEIYLCFTSGSTRKKYYECYPYTFHRSGHYGTSINDCVDLAKTIGCNEPLVQLYEAGFEVAYGVDTFLKSYQTRGRFHILNDLETVNNTIENINVNYISGFPNSIKRLIEKINVAIPYWELGGGYFSKSLIESIFQKASAKAVCNLFASAKSGYTLYSVINSTNDIDEIYKLKPTGFTEISIQQKELYYKPQLEDWSTDHDLFDAVDDKFVYVGRSSDSFFNFENGIKIYSNEIENHALQFANIVEAYIGPNNTSTSHDLYICTSKNFNLLDFVEHVKKLPIYKRPKRIFHVHNNFFDIDVKVSRLKLSSNLEKNNNACIDKIVLK